MPARKKSVAKPSLDDVLDSAMPDVLGDVGAKSDAPVSREGYSWAEDVYFAYEMLGSRVTKAKAGTAARFALCQYAQENVDDFMRNLLPKAMTLLERARDKSGDDGAMQQHEEKEVKTLQNILRMAIKEAADENV